jgi:peptidoglycan/LPS O-acetylase OafA/YrhL
LSHGKTFQERGMKTKHLSDLDGIRARAVAMVFIAHARLDKADSS